MPNCCYNHATISHSDPEKIKQMQSAANEGNLFETFAPIGEWDYMKAIEQWGTKWDANVNDVSSLSANELELMFDTAWAPPIAFYDKLVEQGFEISANYDEEGMAFIGRYSNEDGDVCFEYDFDDENWRLDIDDDEILSLLEDKYESWLDWKAMDEAYEDDDVDASDEEVNLEEEK